ncbi:MAG: hypothetical protein RI922_810 [Bacteroidota bacterium]|jgi:uncharacterized membrane-anchored protein
MEKVNKVAQITLIFWVLKIIATTLGETFGDYLSITLNLGYSTGIYITLAFFLVVLTLQLAIKKHIPPLFWLVTAATTTLGTEISDFIDRSLGLGYTAGSLFLLIGLLITLFVWKYKFKNLTIFPIYDRNKEVFFWMAILFSNSLGTAFGDYLIDIVGLSYVMGALVTGTVILLVVFLHYLTNINHIILFWIAFIFTRPFGATFGDFLTKPISKGGFELGTLNASLFAMILMIGILIIQFLRKQMVRKDSL